MSRSDADTSPASAPDPFGWNEDAVDRLCAKIAASVVRAIERREHRDACIPYVIRGDAPAARFCGFQATDKFIRWATEKGLRPAVRRQGRRTVYRVAELRAALDAEATTGRSRSRR